jgi:hypothetical protein
MIDDNNDSVANNNNRRQHHEMGQLLSLSSTPADDVSVDLRPTTLFGCFVKRESRCKAIPNNSGSGREKNRKSLSLIFCTVVTGRHCLRLLRKIKRQMNMRDKMLFSPPTSLFQPTQQRKVDEQNKW